MPTILTRSAGSARGYGLTGNPTIYRVQQTLQSTTWTAPAGVTNLLTVTGKGQDGAAEQWIGTGVLLDPPGYVPGNVLADVADQTGLNSVDVQSVAQSQYDLFPSTTGDGVWNVTWECRRYVPTIQSSVYSYDVRVEPGFTKTKSGSGWGSTYPPDPGFRPIYFVAGIQYYVPPVNGANTTGFGYTFNGGVAGPASPTTYNNVAVTPGTTYTINSTGDGYIIIVYYLQV